MKRITLIKIKTIVDEYPDFSYLGEFSDKQGRFAIKHSDDPGKYKYFNAENVENIKQAKENYKRMMQYENDEVSSMGIQAIADIQIGQKGDSCLINHIESGGIYGIDSDSNEGDIKAEGENQLSELKNVLLELGFSKKETSEAKTIWEI